MTQKERIIDLLENKPKVYTHEELADYFISSGIVALPCKTEDTVYAIFYGELKAYTVTEIDILLRPTQALVHFDLIDEDGDYDGCYLEAFGKTVFPTRNAAIEAMGGGTQCR